MTPEELATGDTDARRSAVRRVKHEVIGSRARKAEYARRGMIAALVRAEREQRQKKTEALPFARQ